LENVCPANFDNQKSFYAKLIVLARDIYTQMLSRNLQLFVALINGKLISVIGNARSIYNFVIHPTSKQETHQLLLLNAEMA
jgi:hypothetical protein